MTPDDTQTISNCQLSEASNRQPIKCSDQPQISYLVKLAQDLLGTAVLIWILDPLTQRLSGCASAGVDLDDLHSSSVNPWGDNAITRMLASGDILRITAPSQADFPIFCNLLEAGHWAALHCYPLCVGNKTIGATCYAQEQIRDFRTEEIKLMEQFSGLASKILENEFRKREIKSLANVASVMRSSMDFDQAMQYLVDAARELTGAESSTLFLLNTRTHSFVVGFRSPYVNIQLTSSPRPTGGLTWQIMQTGQPIRIDDINTTPNVRDSVKQRGVRSLIGVRVQLKEEQIGVLYINGNRQKQFSDYDTNFLQTLADYASLALGRSKIFLKPTEEIEAVTDKIFNLESTLVNMCKEIERKCQVEYISIQLIDNKEQVIESVFGTGISEKWTGFSKHYLQRTDYLRDLQADIVQSQYTEILNGNDERLDPYIYEKIQGKNIARITTPIMLFRDENGHLLEQCPDQCSWQVLADLREDDIAANSEINENVTQFTVIGLCNTDHKSNCTLAREVIGTVGAGYKDATKIITPETAITLNKVITKWAPAIYQTSLQSVLEVIVHCAMQSVKADSATLHFLHNPDDNTYIYEVCSGAIDRDFLRRHPPRDGGIGRKAMDEDIPKFVPDLAIGQRLNYLKTANRDIYNEGIRAIAAFPLVIDNQKGVLYIHFHREHRFTEDEITLVKIFSKRAADAIRHATAYTAVRNNARKLSVLNTVARSLAKTPRGENLLGDIAWITLNLFAADVVTIYEYIETETRFITPPEIAGKLKYQRAMDTEVRPGDAPYKILDKKGNVWAHDSVKEHRLQSSDQKRPDFPKSFVVREEIKSSAGIKLKVGAETVGLMFINYRRKHFFDDDEKRVILTLASSAAIAIKNRRMLASLSKVDKEILTILDIDSLLTLIVQEAVKISMADTGEIRLIDYHKKILNLKAKHPLVAENEICRDMVPLDQGICGRVATTGKPFLLQDVSIEPRFTPCDPQTKSALCVPLIDKNQHIIGVLNMESYHANTFEASDQRTLESLANRAVIAIQNAENQRRMLASRAMADIGVIASQIAHRMFGDIGLIKERAEDIRGGNNDTAKNQELAKIIYDIADTIIKEIEHLPDWAKEDKSSPFDINGALANALRMVPISRTISVECKFDTKIGTLNFSEKQFIDMISILIQNSIDSMPDGGKLIIGSRKDSSPYHSFIYIWIEDTGIGIAEEDREKIFEAAFTRKKHGKGLGFGLWAVKKVVDRLGGNITVESHVGQGTQFNLSIPIP